MDIDCIEGIAVFGMVAERGLLKNFNCGTPGIQIDQGVGQGVRKLGKDILRSREVLNELVAYVTEMVAAGEAVLKRLSVVHAGGFEFLQGSDALLMVRLGGF